MQHNPDWVYQLKPVLSVIVDNGPDFAPASLRIFYSIGMLFLKLKLDCLIVTTYALIRMKDCL